ncbi:MAG: hypothetical protein WBX01_08405 [Nitrososphaeraceae archaeon]
MENKSRLAVETFSANIDHSAQNLAEENDFRNRYMKELMKKRQHGIDNYFGIDELLEERRQVNQQQMKTPGRRGEIIKHEEIDKEILRRLKNQTQS